ncbi:hypothetical protein KIW84_073551 [Lathyrus oleraceus]|uniref:Uncharacterized protein n=1 Tax=Pisum sativum TaxID=3888 RepID=A0A9D4VQD3_PEA|nr:hypothetical protein KIW84_073551 [Pisum sativum]
MNQFDTDDIDVDEALEDAVISYVNMDARENGALSCRPQAEGEHFRQHIQSYNHVLSFTSIDVHVDENILASGRGIYAFRAQENIGKRTILSSSFIGGRRDMTQRYEDGMVIVLNGGRDRSVDNRWVVPYNPWLLLKYDCHINVEICSSMKSIKYLYKYVYKSPDRVAMEVHKGSYMDEVQ